MLPLIVAGMPGSTLPEGQRAVASSNRSSRSRPHMAVELKAQEDVDEMAVAGADAPQPDVMWIASGDPNAFITRRIKACRTWQQAHAVLREYATVRCGGGLSSKLLTGLCPSLSSAVVDCPRSY